MSLQALPGSLYQMALRELDPNEKVLWAGQPSAGRFALRGVPVAVMGVFVTGFAVFWVAMALWITSGFDVPLLILFPLFGLIFVFAGLAMIFSPLWLIHKAHRTVYVLTDRRAIIFDGGFSTRVRSFSPAALGDLERHERSDGSGDLIFAREQHYSPGYYAGTAGHGGHWVPGRTTVKTIGFHAIPDVRHVEQLVRQVAAQAP
jgi:hypothetical protein